MNHTCEFFHLTIYIKLHRENTISATINRREICLLFTRTNDQRLMQNTTIFFEIQRRCSPTSRLGVADMRIFRCKCLLYASLLTHRAVRSEDRNIWKSLREMELAFFSYRGIILISNLIILHFARVSVDPLKDDVSLSLVSFWMPSTIFLGSGSSKALICIRRESRKQKFLLKLSLERSMQRRKIFDLTFIGILKSQIKIFVINLQLDKLAFDIKSLTECYRSL